DGLDGLAAGVAAIALLFFLGSPFAAALLGALLGFLWYNAHPARVIMGGVGAEALGAGLAALAITQGTVWYLPLVLLVPVLEVVSVILQVSYFRATGGKRIFRMTPLHHHFELGGWPETRIVQRAYVVTALLVALALALRGAARARRPPRCSSTAWAAAAWRWCGARGRPASGWRSTSAAGRAPTWPRRWASAPSGCPTW